MPKVIICEGVTDAILISYMLKKVAKYNFSNEKQDKRLPQLPNIPNAQQYWYVHSDNRLSGKLLIWSVGGIGNIPKAIQSIITRNINEHDNESRFDTVAIVCDRDKSASGKRASEVVGWFKNSNVVMDDTLSECEWTKCSLTQTPDRWSSPETMDLKLFLFVLPEGRQGNLETFLIDAIAKSAEESRTLVQKSENFIGEVPPSFFTKERLKSKAQLGAILSVMHPDWVFSEIDRRLTSIPWEELVKMDSWKKLAEGLCSPVSSPYE